MEVIGKSSKIVDIIQSPDAKLYDTYTVRCEYLTQNKDVKLYYPLNKYSIVINDCEHEVNPSICELGQSTKDLPVINYSPNVYKNLSWTMQNL